MPAQMAKNDLEERKKMAVIIKMPRPPGERQSPSFATTMIAVVHLGGRLAANLHLISLFSESTASVAKSKEDSTCKASAVCNPVSTYDSILANYCKADFGMR